MNTVHPDAGMSDVKDLTHRRRICTLRPGKTIVQHQHRAPKHVLHTHPLKHSSLMVTSAIYKSRNVSKSKVYATLLAQNGAWHVFNVLDKEKHARKNRIMRQSLTQDNLHGYEPFWIQQTTIFIGRLLGDTKESAWSAPRNVAYYGESFCMLHSLCLKIIAHTQPMVDFRCSRLHDYGYNGSGCLRTGTEIAIAY